MTCCAPRYIAAALILLLWTANDVAADPFQAARDKLVDERIATAGVVDTRVLDAIRRTPRHEFIPRSQWPRAYYDMALPIGHSQTISSPFIVASMTEALQPQATDKVLEIGTGSGYQAAVLSPLVQHVYTIEIVPELGEQATATLAKLDYENVSTRVGDGFQGWPSAAPFDKIIVTCSPESVPVPLVEQLRDGGVMIIPVGERYQQTLFRMVKVDGKLQREALRPTLFVPMTGAAENNRSVLPDPKHPVAVNGNFESRPAGDESKLVDFVPGWYYGRQVFQVTGKSPDPAPEGNEYVRFQNETPGRNSHLLQGIAIDGRAVSQLRLSGHVRTESIEKGPSNDAMPMIAISLYDELRRDLGTFHLGPFRGTRPWREHNRLIRVPITAREAILRVGLFGATGKADFDDVQIEAVDR
ncbi:protein-L-isoaspartate(D-aspartate) O-methyltransferase [Stieleria sp. TO1_6]|uniref:protein-L-isoaspartate(D-aspartate) O-methyltransferase n=1 Tax=Stieleria tagensis TaxID=2956795 RepID=UPI00209AD9FB|nr:protein-L-isoaspartate(D-aspartate) O-methyltransferase [Stieleria tagensis]MCO8120728.1 protein-L-isoaspartate(D-aspartate) O-methyltransferase [Stieleria tagensis]